MPHQLDSAADTGSLGPHDIGLRRREWLARARTMIVVDAASGSGAAADDLRSALRRGGDLVQLRERTLAPAQIVQAARGIRRLCDAYDALLIVDDRPDLALVCGADGVQIDLASAHPAQVRRFVGEDLLIGLSALDSTQAGAADGDAAIDFICEDFGAPPQAGDELARVHETDRPAAKPHFARG